MEVREESWVGACYLHGGMKEMGVENGDSQDSSEWKHRDVYGNDWIVAIERRDRKDGGNLA